MAAILRPSAGVGHFLLHGFRVQHCFVQGVCGSTVGPCSVSFASTSHIAAAAAVLASQFLKHHSFSSVSVSYQARQVHSLA